MFLFAAMLQAWDFDRVLKRSSCETFPGNVPQVC